VGLGSEIRSMWQWVRVKIKVYACGEKKNRKGEGGSIQIGRPKLWGTVMIRQLKLEGPSGDRGSRSEGGRVRRQVKARERKAGKRLDVTTRS